MSFWENLFGGATTAGGIYALMDELGDQRGNVGDTISGLTGQVGEEMQFRPYGVTTGMGSYNYDNGQATMGLSGPWQQLSNQMRGAAGNALQQTQGGQDYLGQLLDPRRANATDPTSYQGIADMKRGAYGLSDQYMGLAGQDPTAREGEIYERIRATQRPDEMRQQEQMNANLFGSGRGGLSSSAYGGSPEQHAYNMARNEAMNQASLGAMGQAQNEMMNYGSMANQFSQLGSNLAGQQQNLASQNVSDILGITGGMGQLGQYGAQAAGGLMSGAMDPYKMLMQQGQLGQRDAQMANEMAMNRMNMYGTLGLGGLGTELNYSNIMGNLLGQSIPALAGAAGGIGSAVDEADGFMDFLKTIGIG